MFDTSSSSSRSMVRPSLSSVYTPSMYLPSVYVSLKAAGSSLGLRKYFAAFA